MADDSSSDEEDVCPLCMEPYDPDDIHFYPCECGYQICRFCWHRIRTVENGLCPACRTAYSEKPANYTPAPKEALKKKRDEQKQKMVVDKSKTIESRKHLQNVRVVQRNLVYVTGLPAHLADDETTLMQPDLFGQFGKILKVVINRNIHYNTGPSPTVGAYVTFAKKEDAAAAVRGIDGLKVGSRTLAASFGTTKYCTHFLRNLPCPNQSCLYLHEVAEETVSYTKEDMIAGKHTAEVNSAKQASSLAAALGRGPVVGKGRGTVLSRGGASNVATTIVAPPSSNSATYFRPGPSRSVFRGRSEAGDSPNLDGGDISEKRDDDVLSKSMSMPVEVTDSFAPSKPVEQLPTPQPTPLPTPQLQPLPQLATQLQPLQQQLYQPPIITQPPRPIVLRPLSLSTSVTYPLGSSSGLLKAGDGAELSNGVGSRVGPPPGLGSSSAAPPGLQSQRAQSFNSVPVSNPNFPWSNGVGWNTNSKLQLQPFDIPAARSYLTDELIQKASAWEFGSGSIDMDFGFDIWAAASSGLSATNSPVIAPQPASQTGRNFPINLAMPQPLHQQFQQQQAASHFATQQWTYSEPYTQRLPVSHSAPRLTDFGNNNSNNDPPGFESQSQWSRQPQMSDVYAPKQAQQYYPSIDQYSAGPPQNNGGFAPTIHQMQQQMQQQAQQQTPNFHDPFQDPAIIMARRTQPSQAIQPNNW